MLIWIKKMAIVSSTLILIFLSMFISGQSFWNYIDTGLIALYGIALLISLLLIPLKEWHAILKTLTTESQLSREEITQQLSQIRESWKMLLSLSTVLCLASTISALANAEQMAYIGSWLAVLLLSGVYLSCLRFFIYQPIQMTLEHKRQRLAIEIE